MIVSEPAEAVAWVRVAGTNTEGNSVGLRSRDPGHGERD